MKRIVPVLVAISVLSPALPLAQAPEMPLLTVYKSPT
jgi:hypothetical protein